MKNKKIKHTRSNNEDTKEIKTLIIITLIIVVLSVGLYYLTESSLDKKKTTSLPEAVISYSEITVGTMFSRPYDEYYVLAYKNDDENANQLDNLFVKYDEKEGAKKIYFINLANNFNSFVLSEQSNKKPANASEVKINNYALILIKNGKVSKYYETISEIEKVLS